MNHDPLLTQHIRTNSRRIINPNIKYNDIKDTIKIMRKYFHHLETKYFLLREGTKSTKTKPQN